MVLYMAITNDGKPLPEPKWLTNEDLAARFQVSLWTVRHWRDRGIGPKGTRLRGLVRYSLDEVERWEREQTARAG